jgi:hypothetical protein
VSHSVRRGSRGTQAAGGAFNPLTDVAWDHAYWAEGPEYVALGYGNGVESVNWPDEIGTADLPRGGGGTGALYSATGGANSKPALNFATSRWHQTGVLSWAAPWSWVVIGKHGGTNSTRIISGQHANPSFSQIYRDGSGNFGFYMNGEVADGAADTNNHMFLAYCPASGSRVLGVDGAESSGGTSGLTLTVLNTSGGNAEYGNCVLSFVGVKLADVRSDSGWAGFNSWCESYYGLTIA